MDSTENNLGSIAPVCRHEFVRIFQRKIKGLERRLVSTKAYLPVGFKMTDFSHLGEGSYCFCNKCRMRLFPKRTNADKAQARLLLAKKMAAPDLDLRVEVVPEEKEVSVSVEELELESVELEDLVDEHAVNLDESANTCLNDDEA
jgi:hypothetical protein